MKSALRKVVSLLLLSCTTAIGVLTAQPTFTSTPVTTATVGSPYTYGISATDPSNNTLNFSALTLPSWLTLNNNGQSTASQFGSTISTPGGVAGDDLGNIYATQLNGTAIYKIAPDGTTTNWFTRQSGNVYGMFAYDGYLYVSYYYNSTVSRSKITKISLTNPGAGETDVYLNPNSGSAFLSMTHRAGYLYIAGYGLSKVIRVNLSNNVANDVITNISGPFGLGFNSSGILYVASYTSGTIYSFNPATNVLTSVVTGLQNPSDVKVDAYDNVYVSGYQYVRKYTPNFSSFITVYTTSSYVWGMSITPTGALVFGDYSGNRIAKLQTGASLTGTPPLSAMGVNNVSVRVSNGSATADQNFTITVYSAPTISAMPNISRALNQGPITLTNPTSNSNGAITYTSSNPSVVSVSGNTLTLNAQGTATITANQAASGYFNAGSTSFTVTVTAPVLIPASALKFDPSLPAGDNSRLNYVDIANPFRAFQKEMTVEFWMYAPDANLPFGSVMGQGPTNLDQNYSWLMHPNTNGTMTFYVNDGGTLRGTNCNIIAGSWHHYAATSSATSTKFYVDGVLVHTGPGVSGNIITDAASVIHIGKDVRYATRNFPNNDPNNRYATMTIDEVRIWSRELCADEINNNKNCQLLNPATQNGLEEYYTFNQGYVNENNSSVTTLTDFSGKNRNGTLNNFTLNGTSSNWATSGSTNTGTCGAYVTTLPTITVNGSTNLCAGGSVTLTASAGSSYLWSNGATTQSITVSAAGSYSVTVASAGGCKATSVAKTVTVTTINNQSVTAAPINICGTGSSTITLAASQLGVNYTLRNNADNTIIAGPIAGTGAAINFNTGNISATTTYNVLAETGPTGALSLNGSTYVTIPHNANLNVSAGGQLTMEAWVNPAITGQWRNILMKGAYGYGMAIDASNRLYFWDQGAGNAYDTWSNVTVPANTWSHVAVTVQDNGSSLSVKLYLNGVNVGNKTSPIAQINDNTESLIIGRQGTGCGCNYFNGKLDDVRVWNTVRSASEIAGGMNNCLSGTETGLIALYKMDDGNGSTVVDSKSANNGNIVGTATWAAGNVVCGAVCSQQMSATPTITVNPLPTVNPVTNIEVCHNGVAVPAINFAGSVEGATYIWTNDNPSIGLSASGTGNISSFTAQNPGTVPVYANITVTPSFTVDGNTCTGTPVSFVIRVNPIPVIDPIAAQTLCNGAQSAVINITSSVPGATFKWTNLDPSVNIGLANGEGAVIPSFTAVNSSNQQVNANYLVVSYFQGETMGCGTSRLVNFVVNPTPVVTVTPNGPTTFCEGGSVTLSAPAGASYLWSSGQQTQSITVSQSGNYSVALTSATGCGNTSAAVAVTVNPLPATPVISTSGPTLVCAGSPVTLTAPGGQTFGKSIDFNGSNNIVIPHNNSLNFTSQYTVESWIKVNGYQYGTIISKFEDDNNNRGWMVNMGETGDPTKLSVVHSRLGTWTNPIQWNTGFQPSLNTWYHIAVVFDASLSSNHIKLYVNGALTSQTSWPYTLTPNVANMYFGGYDGPGNGVNGGANSRFFNGKIDEVRVWNFARTASDISAFYNQSVSPSTSGLVAAYSFNEASGNAITDATGVNNGTMVNNPTRSTDAPASASSGTSTYLWSNGETSQSIVATAAGNYAVTVTNENGCSATSAPVTISNYALPTISCSGNITANSLANQCGANVSYPAATVTAGPANPTITYSHPSGSFFPIGTTTVTATVTDACGNTASCSFTVTVTDNVNPVIAAPANLIVPAGANCTATGISLGTPVTSDNCSVASVTNNAPTVFPIGTTNVVWTVTDASGNIATATQAVTVKDQTAPVPNVATLPDINGECSVTVTTIPKATDNCNAQITATTTSPLSYNTQGTYTIVWKYTDAAGNFSTQTQTVIVKDVTPPVINCPAPITTIAPNNQCGAVVTFPQPTVTDNCSSGTSGVHTLTSGTQFFDYADNRMETQNSPGLPMTFFPTDGQKLAVFLVNCGSTHYMYQNVTLPSSGPISLGLDMKYTNHYASGFSASQFIAIELRNPSTNAIIATLFKTNPGAAQSTPMTHYTFDLSAYAGQQVRLQVVDATINNYFIDVQLDNITLPGSSLVNGSFETGDYTGWSIGSASTTCGTFGIGSGPSISIVQKAGLPSGSTFPIGTTTNTFEATDLAGNKSTCSFTVTVNAPEISISGNATEIVSGDNTPSATDHTDLGGTIPGSSISKTYVITNNGTAALTISSINISNAAFTRSGISLPATIQPGQSASFTLSFASVSLGVQTAVVTVYNNDCTEAAYSFTVKAEVTCTNPVFVNTNAQVQANTTATTCNAVVNYPLSVTGIPAPGLSYSFSGATTGSDAGTGSGKTFNKGTTHVVVTAVNPCSTVVNEFDVIVSDITPPIAIAQNLVVNLDANGAASVTAALINNGSSDNCGIASISLSKTSFGCNNVGTNNVILTVTDVNGNVSTATAVVTVVDDIKPSITAPAMVSVVNTPGSCMAAVNLGTPETSDNCGVASVTNNAPALFPVGTTIVRWTVTDIHGNVTDTATQEVVVIDNENPTITVSNISVNNDATKCFATVTVDQPETADNCGVSSVVGVRSDNQPLTATYPVGTTTITWTVTDIHGNIKTAVQTIVVTDNEKPSITAPAMVSVVNTPGLCTASVNLGTPVTSDNCGVATVTNNAPALFPVGTTIVRWTVTDIHGNVTDTATQEVVVIDNENPTITVNNISVNNDAGKCGATVAISLPETADNCGVATVMGVRSDNKLLTEDYPVGTTIITWTVRDVNGNVKTATQTIVVTDNEKPVIACAANQVFCANTGGNTQYTVPVLNQSDNCGIASTTYTVTGATNRTGNGTNASGSFAIGTSTVTYTVTDIHGNVSTCSFTVTINPLPVASIAAPTADAFCNQFTLTANSTLSGPFTYQWMFGNNTKATTQQLSLGLTDADGVYSVYTTDANGCRSELPATYNYQKQTLVSSYTILATKEVKLGQYDKVESGSVGVMSSRGEAEFEKYSSVTGAGSFVKAPRIDTDKGVTINSKIYGVASVTLPTMQYNVSNTRYLQDKTINSNVTATVSGNYDEVTLKKGSNVTLTGTVFGKIKLEEGASVRFTSTTIDVAEIQIEKGPKNGGYSYIRFAPNTSIRVSKKVTIGSDVIVNPEAYQVTFYMADNRRDEEKFHVKGDDTRITANIILPDGKLKVTGGNYGDDKCDHRPHSANSCRHRGHGHHDCDHRGHGDKDCRDDVYMTGLFIAEEVESEGKNVIWNSFSCGAGSAPVDAVVSSNNKATVTEESSSLKLQAASKSEEELKVVVMPNPTRTFFTIKLESKYDAPVTMRMVDASGRVVESRTQIGSNSTIQVGHNYNAGNYFAEFVQGNRRKTIQLIKVR
nr:LamG-like jellyroll fold domain-containing protein [uncultured Sediminibacterium sp.]